MRAINTDVLIEKYGDWYVEEGTEKGFIGNMRAFVYDVAPTVDVIEALRWIPVTERLPEAGIRYQVTFESGEVGYADFRNKIFFYDGSAKENVWEIERYYEDEGEVIAWMPLPKPYERSE